MAVYCLTGISRFTGFFRSFECFLEFVVIHFIPHTAIFFIEILFGHEEDRNEGSKYLIHREILIRD